MTIALNLNQDSWNHIFSFTGLGGLKGAVRTSKDNFLLIAINQYAATILLNFKLEVDQPTLSFKRLSNFQNLIDQWIINLESDQCFDIPEKAIEEEAIYLIIHSFDFKDVLESKKVITERAMTDVKKLCTKSLNITDCTSLNFKECLTPLNDASKYIAYYRGSCKKI